MFELNKHKVITVFFILLFVHASVVSAAICDSSMFSITDIEQPLVSCHDMPGDTNTETDTNDYCQHCDYSGCHSVTTISSAFYTTTPYKIFNSVSVTMTHYAGITSENIYHPPRP